MCKRILVLGLVLAVILSMFIGCSSKKSEDTSSESTKSTLKNESTSKEVEKSKKELILAMVTDVVSLDPHAKDSGTEMQLASSIYDALVDYNNDLSLKPGLAESWEVINDGYTWKFNLRKGVKFTNGSEFNADDVIYSINRARNNKTLEMGVYLLRVKDIEKIDDYTVHINTKIAYPVFSGSLKHIAILDKETTEGMSTDEISKNPIGTGRYILEEHVKESKIVLIRNENYWGDKPEATKVIYRVISEAATRTAALLNNEVDFISRVPVMDIDRVDSTDGISTIENANLSVKYLGFDHLNKENSAGTDSPNPLQNKLVRQAIYHAIDIDTIVSTIFRGHATPAISYMPSIVVGYNKDAKRLSYDPELAKKLLADAGYSDGFYLRIDSRNDGKYNEDQVTQAIASYLEKIGIETEVNLMPRATYFETTSGSNLQSSFFLGGWGDSSGEGMVILNDMIYTYEGKPGLGEGNKGHYSNAEVDALLDKASIETDLEKRADLTMKADKIAREEVACIPLFFANEIFGVSDRVKYTPRSDGHVLPWDFEFLK